MITFERRIITNVKKQFNPDIEGITLDRRAMFGARSKIKKMELARMMKGLQEMSLLKDVLIMKLYSICSV